MRSALKNRESSAHILLQNNFNHVTNLPENSKATERLYQ